MVGRICPPPGWDRVKVSENLDASAVAPVALADTSLHMASMNGHVLICKTIMQKL
jgi:ankyrin repeat protein